MAKKEKFGFIEWLGLILIIISTILLILRVTGVIGD
jgi:competence protein ComGC